MKNGYLVHLSLISFKNPVRIHVKYKEYHDAFPFMKQDHVKMQEVIV